MTNYPSDKRPVPADLKQQCDDLRNGRAILAMAKELLAIKTNAVVKRLRSQAWEVPDIADLLGLSASRIYQILGMTRTELKDSGARTTVFAPPDATVRLGELPLTVLDQLAAQRPSQ